ncbi:Diaminopimelate decarboxylase [Porphyridium purpureum]|uniref:Diaminopimelate decarboxylase n=1 Tax=Porphyridium purpureum TaxID=35688 RepID=A0A5J4YJ55_PORPP|nr:Diaminopimelate decarboxylase [Porphyridium purpureum]|eukprot:POR2620..scf251_18
MVLVKSSQVTAESLRVSSVIKAALQAQLIDDENPSGLFYDLTLFRKQCKELITAFPPSALHGFAIKANPVVAMVREARKLGMGAECASIAEVHIALEAGVHPSRIIYDSPAKTRTELVFALSRGIYVNADNLQEVERIAALRERHERCRKGLVGVRINPQTGAGKIKETSTASASSKFGVPLKEQRGALVQAFKHYKWLCGVHVHVGSQGCGADQLIEGARVAYELAEQLNAERDNQVTNIDIGGGLSANYDSDEVGMTFAEYACELRERVPGLFTGKYRILTEFGRRINAKVGWFAAQVEYTKHAGGRNIVLCHAGAHMFQRPVYLPEKWYHRIEVYDAQGNPKAKCFPQDEWIPQDIGGPLCFSGDLLAVGRVLPRVEQGDWIVVRDSGAYTLSMFSRHTSQLVPGVYGYEESYPSELSQLKRPETPFDVVDMYHDGEPR